MRNLFGAPNDPAGAAGRRPRRALRLPRVPHLAPDRAVVPAHGPVVLVLPARDEEATVAAVVARAPTSVGGRAVRVVVVDDGSSDRTAARARAAGAEVCTVAPGRGLGAAVRTGLAHAVRTHHASVVAFCDADGEYAPEELDALVLPILEGRAHYVVGSRFAGTIESMQRRRRAGNLVLTAILRRIARVPLTDGQSGYRALSHDAAADAVIIHDYNYAQVLTLDLLAKGYGYHEVPIGYRFRTSGQSFVKLHRYLRRVAPAIYRQLNGVPAGPTTAAPGRVHRDPLHGDPLHRDPLSDARHVARSLEAVP